MSALLQLLTSVHAAAGGGPSGDNLPTVRGTGGAAPGTGDVTPALPSGTAENDILLLFVETDQGETITASGYTHAPNSPSSGTNTRLHVLWKRAGASESAPTVTGTTDHKLAHIIGLIGCITTQDPFHKSSANSGSGTTASITGVDTTVNNCLIVAGFSGETSSQAGNGWANANLASLTSRMFNSTELGNGGGLSVCTGTKITAGTIGNTTCPITSGNYAGWYGALAGP